jgi:hypothetical protein
LVTKNKIKLLIKQSEILSQQYDAVITNPPYFNKYNEPLKAFVNANYKDFSKDLFSIFIYKNLKFSKPNAYLGFMTPFVWMFISSYEKLREYLINEKFISSLIQLEYSAFADATVPLCTFILRNTPLNLKGTYLKLSEFIGGMDIQEEKVLESANRHVNYKYFTLQKSFAMIPGSPIAYWVEPELINAFKNGNQLKNIASPRQGIATGNNEYFLRYWHEVNFLKIGFDYNNISNFHNSGKKYVPFNKGGKYRKWYGNQEYVLKFDEKNYELLSKSGNHLPSKQFYFKESISWSKVSSGNIAFRFFPSGFIFADAGNSIFTEKNKHYLLGFLNSKVCKSILSFISPTMNYEVGHIATLPIIYSEKYFEEINYLVKENINFLKKDWDNFETSWNFKIHPLFKYSDDLLSNSFILWEAELSTNFKKTKQNEEKINQLFMNIYNSENFLSSMVKDSDISMSFIDTKKDIKSFISYFIGCLFGRYSLDEEGLIYAGGEFKLSNYTKFIPDDDNIIPILDTEYFEDDIITKFTDFLKVTFGEDTLEENLVFIAKNLKNKGKTNREIIRNYFLSDFFKNHVRTYKKTPIYWLFDSGKENGFKALIYMHRYSPDIVARIRTDYLHKTQKAIEMAIQNKENIIQNSSNPKKISEATKDRNKLVKQLEETRIYDEALSHIANQQIEIDLDDGVKVNYAKFQEVEISTGGGKLIKVNLLKTI